MTNHTSQLSTVTNVFFRILLSATFKLHVMTLRLSSKQIFVETVVYLYVALFVYAAVNKIMDFENFQVQLAQSPLLSSFAGIFSYSVPVVELIIVILLMIPNYRIYGLFASFSLMVMFSAYIYIMLHYSPFVPCSCGGILENLSWNEHLIFNLCFVIFAGIAVLLSINNISEKNICRQKKKWLSLPLSALFGISVVAFLFLLSEDMIHHRNNFVRRFPHHPAVFTNVLDLKFNSYYIAGADKGNVYLGNATAPLSVTVVDSTLLKKEVYIIQLPHVNLNFRSFKIVVAPPYFYLIDGTAPFILKGNISDWKASVWMSGNNFFNAFASMNNKQVAVRAIDGRTGQNILGILAKEDRITVRLNSELVKAKSDGIFTTDGMLLYNSHVRKLLYTYYYKNEFIVANPDLSLDYLGHTIDTATGNNLKVAFIKSSGQRKLATPAETSNKRTATYDKYLFVHSALMGKYELREMWDVASIIDVYDILNKTYVFSFYINDEAGKKMSQFSVQGHLVFAIAGRHLTTYHLKTDDYQITTPEVIREQK